MISLDKERRQLQVNGQVHSLTRMESRLMALFMDRPGELIDHSTIFREVWEIVWPDQSPDTLHVHVAWLRNKIEPDRKNPSRIINHRGKGYLYNP